MFINDLKRQIQRNSEINKSLVERVKERDALLENASKDRDFYQHEGQQTAKQLRIAH